MPGVNYVIYGCSSVKAIPGVSRYWSCTMDENIIAVRYYSKQGDRRQFEKTN